MIGKSLGVLTFQRVGHLAVSLRKGRSPESIRNALEGLGASHSHVIRTRFLLTRREDWESVGKVHGEIFGEIRPVTTVM